MRCWLFGHKGIPGGALLRFDLGVDFRPFMDGAEVRLCDRCGVLFWRPYVSQEARVELLLQRRAEVAAEAVN